MGLIGKWVESLDYEYEILKTCSRYKSPRSTCQKCVDICEKVAIKIENNIPVINRENCVECGNCISACPVQAVAGIFPKREIVQNKLLITSEYLPNVKELLVLYKKGVRGMISEDASFTNAWSKVIEEANMMLNQLGEEAFSVLVGPLEEKEELYSRRELFALWKKKNKFLMKQVVPVKWRFNHEDLNLTKYYPDYQFAKISINLDKCTLCRACELLCEKKCLKINETNLAITAQTCSLCQLCVDICPEKAITIENDISLANDTDFPIYKMKCSVCQQPYMTLREYDKKCFLCAKREGYLSTQELKF